MSGASARLRACWALLFAALALAAAAGAQAIERIDAEAELAQIAGGVTPRRHIAEATSRIALFAFEDPDRTGLGPAASALIGRHVLLEGGLASLGVLQYEGSLAPNAAQPASYFAKVDTLVSAQAVSLAVWGAVRRDGDGAIVDIYLQVPPALVAQYFTWTLRLPAAMGEGTLRAELRPTRILVQRVAVSRAEMAAWIARADEIATLRAEPRAGAPVLRTIPGGRPFGVDQARDGWTRLTIDGVPGWARDVRGCGAPCAALIQSAQYAHGLLRYLRRGVPPEAAADLAPDAHAVASQLALMAQRGDALARWSPARLDAALDAARTGKLGPDARAQLANLRAIFRLSAELAMNAGLGGYDALAMPRERLEPIVRELALASQDDPSNADLLANLALLFRAVGDERKATLARALAAEARARGTR